MGTTNSPKKYGRMNERERERPREYAYIISSQSGPTSNDHSETERSRNNALIEIYGHSFSKGKIHALE